MGNLLIRLFNALGGTKDRKMLMLGLDAAGKTTILTQLQLGELHSTVPTVGFNVADITYKNLRLTMWDVGGQTKIRRLWRYYYQGTHALIFVVDSSDIARLEEAREELELLLSEAQLNEAVLLVYANKADIQGSMSACEVAKGLGLTGVSSTMSSGGGRGRREWYVQSSCGTNGNGLYEGLDWLAKALNRRRDS
nr:Arf1b [Vischeria sp. CAUP Q 202]